MLESNNNIKSEQHFYLDKSFWSLVIANIVTIVWAFKENWSLDLIIWVYFCQNIIIGIFWPAKIFASAVDASYKKKIESASLFLPHYFTVHLAYAYCSHHFFGKAPSEHFAPIVILAGLFLFQKFFLFLL